MARQSPGRRNAEEHAAGNVAGRDEVDTTAVDDAETVEDTDTPDTEAIDTETIDDAAPAGDGTGPDGDDDNGDADDDDEASGGDAARVTAEDRPLWRDVNIDPVEIALPVGIGYTLRAYRMASTLTPTEVAGRDDEDLFASRARPVEDDDEVVILDDDFAALIESEDRPARARGRDGDPDDDEPDEDEPQDEDEDGEETDEAEDGEPEDGEPEDEEPEEDTTEDEEVPVFLSHRGKLLLFHSTESLVEFVRSGQPNDLAQLEAWAEVVDRIEVADIAPREDDTYELDLVVENLRGGHDTWDLRLLIAAGEIARDLAYALRIEPIITALSPGSPLDDLDEALRRTADGGLGGFLGRRRLRKIGAQQATLGWRTIIGKISAAVDWRD